MSSVVAPAVSECDDISQVTASVETAQPGRVVVTVSLVLIAEAAVREVDDPAAGVYSLSRARDARAARMGRLA